MTDGTMDIISGEAVVSLAGLFRERVRRTPDTSAYLYFDAAEQVWRHSSWREMAQLAARWQVAMERDGLADGDRIAIMARNSREWVCCEQAALGLGMVVVPLYVNDRAENAAYILRDSDTRWLLIEGEEHWRTLCEVVAGIHGLQRIVSLEPIAAADDPRVISLAEWLPKNDGAMLRVIPRDTNQLATIVYTSGTTGNPKGVMLSHRNILWNARVCLDCVQVYHRDLFLSFLPLSHALERTVGHYVPMMAGATVAHARAVALLAEDMLTVRPTIMITVPRIFERIYSKIQEQLAGKPLSRALFERAVAVGWQRFQRRQRRAEWSAAELAWPLLEPLVARKVLDRLGGRLRVTICGGAALPQDVARVFLGLGLPLLQGYGLTETSPVISTNTLEDNDPTSVGMPLPEVAVQVAHDHELLVKSPSVCLGYWHQPEATAALIDSDGWLHTGDKARLADKHLYITGRLKEIIVMANGEKVPPADMEAAIARDPLVDQVLVIGEGRPYLSALLVLNVQQWRSAAQGMGVDADALHDAKVENWMVQRIARQCSGFPGYAKILRVALSLAPWTVENGLCTPTLKLRRNRIAAQFRTEIERLYQGH